MAGADAGEAAGNDLAALGDKALQQADIAVADGVDLLGAELADLLAAEELASPRTAAGTAGATGTARGARGTGSAGACVSGTWGVRPCCGCFGLLRSGAGFVSHFEFLSISF